MVVGVSAVGLGYGNEAHQVAMADIRRASRRHARALDLRVLLSMGVIAQGVQVCRCAGKGGVLPFLSPVFLLILKRFQVLMTKRLLMES